MIFKLYLKLDANTAECKNLILHKGVGVKCNFRSAEKSMEKFGGECLFREGEMPDFKDKLSDNIFKFFLRMILAKFKFSETGVIKKSGRKTPGLF